MTPPRLTTRTPSARVRLAGVTVLAALSLAACGQGVSAPKASEGGSASAASFTTTNCGSPTQYKAKPQRVVALSVGQAEILTRLGLADSIVGVAQLNGQELPRELKEREGKGLQVLSQDSPPSRETLLKAQPDLVLSPTTYEFSADQGFATKEQLSKGGAQTDVAAAGCFDRRSKAKVRDLFTDIAAYGEIFGKQKEAQQLIEQGEKTLAEAKKRSDGKTKPRTAQLFIDGDHITAIGAGVEHDLLLEAGAQPVFSPKDKEFSSFFAAEVSKEAVAAKAPEVIVLTASGKAQEKKARDYLKANLPDVPAVKNNRIVVLDSNQVLPGTWGLVEGVEKVSKAMG